ncbi:ATP-binding cassette domain-containing protein [Halioxenophilus aromaticivorans]|uniref:Heme ABC transporter ATP-binding protein n=1 Tax=Halioxenophilus aromaticivorans TaxID=1306992 RepID=A0AAV3U3P8_9ALTE
MCIAAHSLSYSLGQKRVLSNVYAQLAPGVITAVIGPPKSGKTALLKCLSGEWTPTQGRVCWRDGKSSKPAVPAQTKYWSQSIARSTKQSVFEAVSKFATPRPRGHLDILLDLFHQFDLTHLLRRSYCQLTNNQKIRVRLVSALFYSQTPNTSDNFLTLSEPIAEMSALHQIALLNCLKELASQGIGSALVIHDLNLAARFADRLILLLNGELVASGNCTEVLGTKLISRTYHSRLRVEYHQQLHWPQA